MTFPCINIVFFVGGKFQAGLLLDLKISSRNVSLSWVTRAKIRAVL